MHMKPSRTLRGLRRGCNRSAKILRHILLVWVAAAALVLAAEQPQLVAPRRFCCLGFLSTAPPPPPSSLLKRRFSAHSLRWRRRRRRQQQQQRLFAVGSPSEGDDDDKGQSLTLSLLVNKMQEGLLGLTRPFSSSVATSASAERVDRALENLVQLGIVPSSWSTVRSVLESQMTPAELEFRTNIEHGYGEEGSPLHKIRLYTSDNKPEHIRVVFYRDSASWCPYCQKVWIALEEKQIPYRVEKINMRCYGDKSVEFMRMQPSGQIPVARIDGTVYGQSNDILYALEETFSSEKHRPLLPRPPVAAEEMRERSQSLLRLERELFSAWMYWLTGSPSNKNLFVSTLNKVEKELGSTPGPFFLGGDRMSLVDIMYAPFLERMTASLCYYKGFVMRVPPGAPAPYPYINRWFDGMEAHPSYRLTKSDYYTHAWDLPPQLGGCAREPAGMQYERAINGQDHHWRLPLEPHLGGIEPDWSWIPLENEAKRQAVERVSANHDAIVRFACRGAGSPGFPGVSAPLSDPNAVPNMTVFKSVDSLLKVICMAILEGTNSQQDALDQAVRAVIWGEDGDNNKTKNRKTDEGFVQGVVASLQYVRDRVGVPRDMTLPAARQLRAVLNWAIDALQKQ